MFNINTNGKNNNPACQRVLQSRMSEGNLDSAPIFEDIVDACLALESSRETDLKKALIDILGPQGQPKFSVLQGGWPCQGIAASGKRLGVKGDGRSALFFAIVRLVRF